MENTENNNELTQKEQKKIEREALAELERIRIQEKKEAASLKIVDLDVILFPVEMRDNPRNTNREYSKVVTGIIDGEEVDLNYCSPVYELVPNSEIFPVVEDILNANGIEFTAIYSHTNFTRFYGEYQITDDRFTYTIEGTNDKIQFTWNFQHSYNGLTKYRGIGGFYRLICENGLVIPIAEMNEFNLVVQGKHTSSILNSLAQFNSMLVHVIENLDTVKNSIGKRFEILASARVYKPRERIEEIFKNTGLALIENSNFSATNYIMARIDEEKKDLGIGVANDWLIYNGINNYIYQSERNIAAPEKRREIDSKVLEYMLKQ